MGKKPGVGRAELLAYLKGQTERRSTYDIWMDSDLTEYAVRYHLQKLEMQGLADRVPGRPGNGVYRLWALTEKGRAEALVSTEGDPE